MNPSWSMASLRLFANHVNKTNYSFKLINNLSASLLIGNISYTVTASDNNPGLFYSYSNYGFDSVGYGAGVNVGGWLGLEFFAATPGDIGIGLQVTPWVHGGAQIGLSGIGMTIGMDADLISHDLSINIGWGTTGLVALSMIPIPGARAAAATVAAVIFLVGWFRYGDGGHYF
ncbi:hypothetical protein Aocu_14040 [Acholeplasma oculi]|uniref:Uncharacterized protein n=1 Tax=Acholeplasma oculi TaxID=35623 RepID=A0A061AKB3_9MOLU|nr:hypothetical protein Aocu_14040 [Acholeplasma oculi]